MQRPPVHRTYGKSSKLGPSSSSSSIVFDLDIPSSSPSLGRSSSPPTSSPPLTPEITHVQLGDKETDSEEDEGPLFPEQAASEYYPRGIKRRMIDDIKELKPIISLPAGKSESKSGQSSLRGFFTSLPRSSIKKPLRPAQTVPSIQSRLQSESSSSSHQSKSTYTQSHLTHLPLLHTCHDCAMSYVRSSPTDEVLHKRHHARVVRGIIWDGLGKGKGRAIERDTATGGREGGWRVVEEGVRFGSRGEGVGRVIMCDGSHGGIKLEDIHFTVDTVLSAPALPLAILNQTKTFLFITSFPPPINTTKRLKPSSRLTSDRENTKERIVAVVVAQGIKWGMRVLRPGETLDGVKGVDSGGGVICDPKRLDTPLGIHRLFTVPSYRSLGLAHVLLDAAAGHTVYGCVFDPKKGEVAFSQPTESGRAVMEKWGKGEVRVFVDDESQL